MRNGWHIGRLFGINIYVDWSWLLILLLVTGNLATGFAQVHPNWGPGLIWIVAIVAALLFFASVLAHELAHSIVARAQDIPVRNITLFLFGGVSNIQQDPRSPRAEFLMAIVGPITSIVIGVICLLAAGALVRLPAGAAANPGSLFAALDPLTTLLLWLGPINILLGIFNLVPGFPLDGGRVLRAALWAATGNVRTATRWAAWVGQAIAWLLIFTGIAMIFGVQVPFFGAGVVNGLWLAFIGWFLSSAARQSERQVVIHDMLEGIPAARLMHSNVLAVPPMISVGELVYRYVMGTDEQAFPVLDGDRLLGLVTLEDIRKVAREAWDTTAARDIMTPADQLAVVRPQDDAATALDKLMEHDAATVPVIADGHLLGLIRRRDIMRWLQLQAPQAAAR
jgi:Zn-dependent protease/predicted transcriptional regulator